MKVTLDINDSLLVDAKALAIRQRTSLDHLIEEALQTYLLSATAPGKLNPVRIPVIKGRGGLVSGVDPTSNRALLCAIGNDA